MLGVLSDAEKFVITATTALQYRCISGSGTYVKINATETLLQTVIKSGPHQLGEVEERYVSITSFTCCPVVS